MGPKILFISFLKNAHPNYSNPYYPPLKSFKVNSLTLNPIPALNTLITQMRKN
jgi:hypothetical protein